MGALRNARRGRVVVERALEVSHNDQRIQPNGKKRLAGGIASGKVARRP
jgi:hypothetical protein